MDVFYTKKDDFYGSYEQGEVIVPSDTIPLSYTTRAIYVGTGGTVTFRFGPSQTSITLTMVPSGTILPVRADLINATGTTALNLVGLF